MGWQQFEGKSAQALKTPDCLSLCEELGDWAPWLLDDAILARAEQHYRRALPDHHRSLNVRPTLLTGRGHCWILCVCQRDASVLKKQFLMPVRWVEAEAESFLLPDRLRELGAQVREQVRLKLPDELRGKKYELRSMCRSNVDLSGIDISPDSGWASLVGGLMSCALGGKNNGAILTSAAWSHEDQRVLEVDYLEDKINLADAHSVKKIFVPESQQSEARQLAKGKLEVGVIKQDCDTWHDAVHEYLVTCTIPPDEHSSLAERVEYYLHQPDKEDADRYYRDVLLEGVAEGIRGSMQKDGQEAHFEHYVACVSNVNIVALGALVSQATHLHLFYTEDKQQEVDQLRRIFPAVEIKDYVCSDKQQLYDRLRRAGQEKSDGNIIHGNKCVIDLLPGDKYMSILLMEGWHDSWKMFFQQGPFNTRGRSDPREITAHLWQGIPDASD